VIAACTLLVGQPNPSTPSEGDIDVTLTASPLSGPRFDIMGRETVMMMTGGNSNRLSLGKHYLSSADKQRGEDGGEGGGRQYPYDQISENLSSEIIIPTSCRLHDQQYHHPQRASTPSPPVDVKEIESWIRRTLRTSRFVNPTELGIEPGVSAWRIRVSIHILNHEGNIWDASLLAACAALSDLRIPMVEIERGIVRIVKNEKEEEEEGGGSNTSGGGTRNNNNKTGKVRRREGRTLTLGPPPVPLTIAILENNSDHKINDSGRDSHSVCSILLVDPTHLEENVASGNIVTVVCNTREEIVEFHKKGSGSRLSMEQMAAVGCMGFGRARELENLIVGAEL
jgi:exosome complex RNA-binding protein Rrp42 (RNase PH superfamily)